MQLSYLWTKRYLIIGLVLLSVSGFSWNNPFKAAALSGTDFNPGHIIDDAIFFNENTLSSQEIQSFLNSKLPSCDTQGQITKYDPTYNDTVTRAVYSSRRGISTPFTCLKNYTGPTVAKSAEAGLCNGYTQTNETAAQTIYGVAHSCGINPEVLIVLLQKEQGLVTDDWPWPNEYQGATGYGCPDTAACDSQYYGFFNQVYSAARQFKYYEQKSSSFNFQTGRNNSIQFNPSTGCGSSTVLIQNIATAGLYNYTPYQPNSSALSNIYGSGDACSAYGNRNFWRYFNDWFGPTVGTKILTVPGSATFYVYSSGVKIPIPSLDIYRAYGFDTIQTTVTSASYLNGLPTAAPLTSLARYNDGTIELIDNGNRYNISSLASCSDWGLSCSDPGVVNTLDNDMFNTTKWIGYLQPLMASNGSIYKMVNGSKLPFLNLAAIGQNGYNFGQISSVTGINAVRPLGALMPSTDTAFRLSNGSVVLYAGGQNIAITNLDMFYRWGLDINYYPILPPSLWDSQPPLTNTTLSDGYVNLNGTKILLDSARKIDVTAAPTDWPVAPVASGYMVNLLNRLPSIPISTSSCLQTSTGDLVRVERSMRRSIRLIADLYQLGCNANTLVRVDDSSLSVLSVGPAKLTPNRLFKKAGAPTIYMVTSDTSSVTVPNYDYVTAFGQYPNDIAFVDDATLAYYPSGGSISSLAGNTTYSTYFLYSPNGSKYYFSNNTFSDWGISKQTTPTYDDKIGAINIPHPATQFARTIDGSIYYGSGGTSHLLTSYAAFTRLGGTPDNTMNVLFDFIAAVPAGANIN